MGLIYRVLLVFTFLSAALFSTNALATHVAGADIDYQNIGQDSFLITLNVYRECGNNNSNAQLNTGNIDVDFVSDCGQSFTLNNMTLLNGPTGTEVSQLCPSSLAQSGCNGGTLPGIQHYIFQEIVVLPNTCDSWHMSWTFSARNTSTNLVGQDDMHVSSSLNSATDPTNSSPTFSASPIPFVCNGNQVDYNFGVQDPDGDSLVYSLITPMISSTNTVTWQPGYSAAAPINGIVINSATGQLTFTPNTLGNFVIAVQVCEYDPITGNLLGCVTRDIQLIVENCLNIPPTNAGGGISNTTGNVTSVGADSISVCEGELVNFDIIYFDNVNVVAIDLVSDVQSILPGATTTFTSAADSGVLNINWQVPTNAAGNYTFAVEAFDGVCPVQGVTSNSYTIIVEPSTFASNDTSICVGDTASLLAVGGNSFTWTVISGAAIDTVSASPTYNASCMDCANPQFSPNVTTTYEVTSDLSGACSNKDTVVVTVVDLGLTMIDSTNFCTGDSVSVTANATGASYLWSNGATIAAPVFNVQNTYTVSVYNGMGCLQVDSVIVNENPLPVFTLGQDTLVCEGISFTNSIAPSNPYVNYTWFDGSTAGTYTIDETSTVVWVQVEDTNFCKAADTMEVTLVANPIINLGNDTTICTYDSISLTALYNVDYSYAWSAPFPDTNEIIIENPGVYTVTVVDTLLCQSIDTIEVSEFQDAPITLAPDTGFCAGDTAIINAPNYYVSYAWSNGASIDSIAVSVPSSYGVTVVDTNSCVSSDTLTVVEYVNPVLNLGPDIPYCDGTPFSVIKDVGPLYQSYLWHTGSTIQAHTVTELDSLVWIQVQDTNGCVGSDSLLVYTVQPPMFSLGNDTSFCDGESHVLRAPLGMTNYTWNTTTANVDTLLVGIANIYSVTVQDTNGCTGNDSILIGIDTIPVPAVPGNVAKCVEDTAILDAGVGYLAYIWNTGETTQAINADTAGNYVVTVTDSNSCVGTNGSVVVNNPVPLVDIGPNDTICFGNSVVLDAGTGFVSYLWSNGATTQTTSYDSTGNHWVEVIDTLGCLGTDTMFLMVNDLPIVDLGPDMNLCTGDTGVLDAGAGMVNYFWSNGSGTQTISVVSAGVYSVTVEDTNGCLNSDTNVVSLLSLPTPPLPADIHNCAGSTFDQLVDAGAGFILYNWMDGTFTRIRNATELDTVIWVEVTDTNGCVGSDTMFVNHTPLPTVDIGADDTICASQVYSLNAGNGGGTITDYAWSTGANTQSITIAANTGLPADQTVNYSVTVTDVLGCENVDSMNLTTFALPRPVLPDDTSYCFGDPFAMVLNPGAFDSYLWSTGATTPTINIGAVPNTYGVTVTLANGCVNNTQIVVVENQLPQPNLGPDESFCQGVGYTKILNPGSFDQYAWSDGSFGPVLGVSTPGPYSVTVTDNKGCINNDDIQIVENPLPPVDLGGDQYFCEDQTVATVLDASSLLPSNGFNFIWNTGATTATIMVSQFGQYSVTVTDRITGCATENSMEVIPFPKAAPNLGDNSVICEGQLILLDPMVDIPGYNYTWSTGATTKTINIFESGVYWVQLDADNGSCVGITDTIEFTPGVMPVVELGEDQYVCEGQVVTLLNNLTPFPNSTYSWQDSTESTVRKIIKTGTYEIAVTNDCGTVYDQVYIEFQDCFGIYVPNSFTPNTDGVNETFYPKSDQEFQEYGFWVYDRWGQVVFKTNQPNHGWDGKINGELAPVGMYAWRISYVSANQVHGTRIEKVGEVYLLK